MADNGLTIAIDFDGTCVTHEYPHIGMDVGAEAVLRELTDKGFRLILTTMRDGALLKEAEQWFKERNIPLYGVNVNPSQKKWTQSPKVYADILIDDTALGCPLKFRDGIRHPYVDWERIRELLVRDGFLD